MEYLAHITEDGRKQTVEAHLLGTARLSEKFAAEFGAAAYGRLIGLAHDIGKTSQEFQDRLLRNGKKVDHATAGAIQCLKHIMSASCVVAHHGGLLDFGNPRVDQIGDHTCCGRLKKGLSEKNLIPKYHWTGKLPQTPPEPPFDNDYVCSLWVRMLFSCLVDADYLDTEEFMQGGTVQRDGYDPMKVLLEKLEQYIAPWFPAKNAINAQRCRILAACKEKGILPRGLYSLTVPTGGGKTVASLAFALNHAVANGMKRVIYVIPYTSIIEQNARVFRQILGDENVVEHHSGRIFDEDEDSDPVKVRQRLACENWDAPVIVTTAVQFFESMYANRPSQCRKLHNIANSVVIFDEAQMLPLAHLKPCVGAIANLVAHFNGTAVLCTATQPVLDDLIRQFAPSLGRTELAPDPVGLQQAFARVTFRDGGKLSNEALAEALEHHEQVLCIVNTRKDAQEVFNLLPEEGKFHLSTLMYPIHRQSTLDEIRRRLLLGLPCRVVSTSLIEAGVDVDFPTVYREKAGLDSILQAAGRCNREGKRAAADSIVTYFTGETPAPSLFKTNIGATNQALSGGRDPGNPESIRRYFTALRGFTGDALDKSQVVKHFEKGISGCRLPFETIAGQFHLIEQATKTVYIPDGEGVGLCDTLKSGYGTKQTYRKAGGFGVSIYEQHYRALLDTGDIVALDQESAVLENLGLYSRETGLSLKADYGKALFG